jgi:CubicO group peptidase (beta-lactamase class C family)
MRRRTFLSSTILLGSGLALYGCGGGEDPSTRVPPLSSKQAALDQLVRDFLARTGVPGVSAALLTTSEEIVSVSGVRVLGEPAKILVNDAFHIGSNAKSMLAMLIMRSVELGELYLEAPIYDLVPQLRSTGQPAYASVTLEQLLSHRAGIEPLLFRQDIEEILPPFKGSAIEQRRQTLAFLMTRDPVATPGASFVYSNGGYAAAAAVLEAVTGKSYERLIDERVFTPLGIKGTIGWPGQAVAAAPYGHLFDGATFTPLAPDELTAQFRPALSPAGNVSMNVIDYAKYLRAHLSALRGGTAKSLTNASYQRLHRAIAGTQFGYALGWATDGKDKQQQQVTYHYGSTDIFGCYALLQPAKNRAVAVMVNGEKAPFEGPLGNLSYAILALLD